MTTGTHVVVPGNIPLPARLQTASAAAEIAAANAAAAGGIKSGGFPSISIKANKFHEKEGGELKTYMQPALPGQPALPLQCLEAVVVAANPAITKTYYPGDYVEGSTEEPTCRSSNGVTPDADVAAKQHDVCATCKQNQWGSKISKLSGKEIKACDDSKQLAVLPGADLSYKALGMVIHKGSLGNWGKYVQALSGRGIPITEIVTNITFDATANGVLQFAFNRYLSDDEAAKAKQRAQGDDVKVIVAQSRVIAAPQLAASVQTAAALAPPVSSGPVTGLFTPAIPAPAAAPKGPQFPAETAGFGATAPAAASAPVAVPAEPVKRTRRTREQIAADKAAAQPPTSPAPVNPTYLPPEIQKIVEANGVDSVVGKALLAQFPRPAPAPAPVAAPAAATGFGATAPAAPAPTSSAPVGATSGQSLAAILAKKLGINQPKEG